jgi:hypothetical protein
MVNFSLYQAKALDYLRYGRPLGDGALVDPESWFREAINDCFCEIGESYGCRVTTSRARMAQAREGWIQDVDRGKAEDSDELDHFKQAGYLAYWLRRRVIINAIDHLANRVDDASTKNFVQFGNEIASFQVGFRICLTYEAEARGGPARVDQLSQIYLDPSFVLDVAKLLHYKNVSPHALYLIYRALFYRLFVPDAASGDKIAVLPKPKIVGRPD